MVESPAPVTVHTEGSVPGRQFSASIGFAGDEHEALARPACKPTRPSTAMTHRVLQSVCMRRWHASLTPEAGVMGEHSWIIRNTCCLMVLRHGRVRKNFRQARGLSPAAGLQRKPTSRRELPGSYTRVVRRSDRRAMTDAGSASKLRRPLLQAGALSRRLPGLSAVAVVRTPGGHRHG